jgi:hypothetical protein
VRSAVPWQTSWTVAHSTGYRARNLASSMDPLAKGVLVSCQSQGMPMHAMPSGCVAHCAPCLWRATADIARDPAEIILPDATDLVDWAHSASVSHHV